MAAHTSRPITGMATSTASTVSETNSARVHCEHGAGFMWSSQTGGGGGMGGFGVGRRRMALTTPSRPVAAPPRGFGTPPRRGPSRRHRVQQPAEAAERGRAHGHFGEHPQNLIVHGFRWVALFGCHRVKTGDHHRDPGRAAEAEVRGPERDRKPVPVEHHAEGVRRNAERQPDEENHGRREAAAFLVAHDVLPQSMILAPSKSLRAMPSPYLAAALSGVSQVVIQSGRCPACRLKTPSVTADRAMSASVPRSSSKSSGANIASTTSDDSRPSGARDRALARSVASAK